jgi:LCP family protein required for cell wall assembly
VFPDPYDAGGRSAFTLLKRFAIGAVVIFMLSAATVASAVLLEVGEVSSIIKDESVPLAVQVRRQLQDVAPGKPQTILVIGDDRRKIDVRQGNPTRSDTMILVRLDPKKGATAMMSLPRDLLVDIPGHGRDKLNAAFAIGEDALTLKTIRSLLGIPIHHYVRVTFWGFKQAVDRLGCVYVDIDRKYFNDNNPPNGGGGRYAVIDIKPGYQKLCGIDSLSYVRYRHFDNDIVRAARQQDFLRNARAQVPVGQVLPIIGGDTGSKLIDIFTKYTSSDIDDPAQLIGILKAFIGVRDVPIKEVHFKGTDTLENGIAYVTATPESIHKAVEEFLGDKDSPGGPGGEPDKAKSGDSGKKDEKPKPEENVDSADVVPAADVVSCGDGVAGKVEAFGRTSARRLNFPVYIPESLAPNSCYDEGSRQYDIKDLDDNKQPAYKMVVALNSDTNAGEYYGVMGTTWSDPPILEKPSETREIDGRDYDLFFDGDRLRIVAFHDDEGNSYWVSNTLLQTLSEDQMLAIATSMDKKKG